MSPQVIARRYAQALFDIASRQNALETTAIEVQHLLSLYQESRLLRNLLENPIYRSQQKLQWLRPVVGERLSPLLWTFLQLLTRRGREHLLNETCLAFLELYDRYKKRIRVRVRSAQPLSQKTRNHLTQRFRNTFGAQEVVLQEEVEPELIGGFIVEVGTLAADLSVRGRLREIRKKLIQSQTV
ncbi:MAG: ATP synthase F1 subunit delta [Bacteroidia bacterium]|nr:ATP synthase F1 subunit delta [Bacteroidia bacterium]